VVFTLKSPSIKQFKGPIQTLREEELSTELVPDIFIKEGWMKKY